MLPALIPLATRIFANKWVLYIGAALLALVGFEAFKARERAKGAERERQVYRKRADEMREGMIRAPQHNEEGTADELDNARY